MSSVEKCPQCGGTNIERDEADVGVGTIYGRAGCPDCFWVEDDPVEKVLAEAAHIKAAKDTPMTTEEQLAAARANEQYISECHAREDALRAKYENVRGELLDALNERDAALAAQRKAEEERDEALHLLKRQDENFSADHRNLMAATEEAVTRALAAEKALAEMTGRFHELQGFFSSEERARAAVEAQCAAMRSVVERFLDEHGNGVTIAEMRAALATKGEG